MPLNVDPPWANIELVVASVLAVALAILAATWSKSPVSLPLPQSPHRRWLLLIPVLATAVIVGLLSVFIDCSYRVGLGAVSVISLLLCIILLITQSHLFRKIPDASTLLVVVCLGWCILGTLSVSSLAAMLIANREMDEAYSKNPLKLQHLVGNERHDPPDVINLTAGLPAHFVADMDECHDHDPEITLTPEVGEFNEGTYHAPGRIEREQLVTIKARSKCYQDVKTAVIRLLPDAADVKRTPYPGEDERRRKAVFDLIVISRNDSWVLGSDELVKRNFLDANARSRGEAPQTRVCQPVMALAGSREFEPYVDIISIGTASREGPQAEEEGRANRRSRKIAEWVNQALRNAGREKHVYTMNLGQYVPRPGEGRTKTEDETAQERPVVIIGVVRAGEINLEEALRNVFEEHQDDEFLKFLAMHYPGRKIVSFSGLPDQRSPCPFR